MTALTRFSRKLRIALAGYLADGSGSQFSGKSPLLVTADSDAANQSSRGRRGLIRTFSCIKRYHFFSDKLFGSAPMIFVTIGSFGISQSI